MRYPEHFICPSHCALTDRLCLSELFLQEICGSQTIKSIQGTLVVLTEQFISSFQITLQSCFSFVESLHMKYKDDLNGETRHACPYALFRKSFLYLSTPVDIVFLPRHISVVLFKSRPDKTASRVSGCPFPPIFSCSIIRRPVKKYPSPLPWRCGSYLRTELSKGCYDIRAACGRTRRSRARQPCSSC